MKSSVVKELEGQGYSVIKELESQGYTVEKASVDWNVVTAPIQDKIICGAVWFTLFILPCIVILSK